jgi:hypothetical protein
MVTSSTALAHVSIDREPTDSGGAWALLHAPELSAITPTSEWDADGDIPGLSTYSKQSRNWHSATTNRMGASGHLVIRGRHIVGVEITDSLTVPARVMSRAYLPAHGQARLREQKGEQNIAKQAIHGDTR